MSWIPSEAVKGADEGALRAGGGALRRAAPRGARRPARTGGARHCSASPTTSGLDRGRRRRRHRRPRLRGAAGSGLDDRGASAGRRRRSRPSPSPTSARARGGRRLGALPADRRRAHRRAAAAPGAPSRRSCSTTRRTAWSTLALTLHADGRAEWELEGASPFPRHWVYDPTAQLAAKTGLIDFKDWYRRVRRLQPVGRRGLAGPRHRGRVRARARAVAA